MRIDQFEIRIEPRLYPISGDWRGPPLKTLLVRVEVNGVLYQVEESIPENDLTSLLDYCFARAKREILSMIQKGEDK